MRVRLFAVLLPAALFAATETKPKDACAPPPGGAAPTLPAHILSGQGHIDFPITTSNPKAQEFFNQGVAQMHSFWAFEAERSFLQAAALDPKAPMPYWGVAMVAAGDYRPRFQLIRDEVPSNVKKLDANPRTPEGGPGRAMAAAKKALELSKAPGQATDLEKLYIASIAARRNPDSKDPDGDYIKGLRAIAAAYPNEIEARTYLALHLMHGFTTPDKQPLEGTMEAVAILRDLLIKAPDHMGVHHYVIHGWEGSSFAKEAWPSCRRYPELVPNIPHALHMPGHIWAQTGKWDEAVKSFGSAAENERGYIKADKLYSRGHHGHNVHFLVEVYCFQGKYDKAMEAARELLGYAENPREAASVDNWYTVHRQGWFALMETLVHFEKWNEILDGKTLVVYDKPREQAWRHWAMGIAYASKGDTKSAKAEAKAMEASLKELKAKTNDTPKPLLVARQELAGQIAFASKKYDLSFRTLAAAVRAERALRYTEPPSYPRPVAEALGKMALAKGKLHIAEDAFRQSLEQYPASHRSTEGLAETMRREGKPAQQTVVSRGLPSPRS
jgi:tetratricopeptide (TPR) repeat protein